MYGESRFTKKSLFLALAMPALAALQGCGALTGLLFGGNQQVDNRSYSYKAPRLDRGKQSEWQRLSAKQLEDGDTAYEHRTTGAVISVNSVCREHGDNSLGELTRNLFSRLDKSGPIVSRDIAVNGVQALESTVDAVQLSQPIRVRAVVLRKGGCTYDLMYIAEPEVFERLLPHFDGFVKGFNAR